MKSIYILCAILILAFLAACGLQDKATRPVATSTSPLANTPSLTPSSTDQPTQTPTITSIPTLSEQDALETFVNLIEKDDECELPCWLGITPGRTRFKEVENILSQFGAVAYTDFSLQRAFIKAFFPHFETAKHEVTIIVIPEQNGKISRILITAVAYQDINGPRNYNDPEFQRLWQRYFLPRIFTRYGVPEKIFLDTTRIVADTAGPYPFVLWVVYSQQGFLIRYQGVNSKIGENIQICPMQSSIEIKIWNPEESSYEEFIKDDGALARPFALGPQPIEEVTKFSIESFYEEFRSRDVDTCFDTPASIWPPNK